MHRLELPSSMNASRYSIIEGWFREANSRTSFKAFAFYFYFRPLIFTFFRA
jgi:hypothetical protein